MTTVQESPNGHHPLPPPCSPPDLQDHHRSKDSSDNNSNPDSAPAPATSDTETFAGNADHLPPKRYAPKANAYQFDDYASAKVDTSPLPERCQFMFSDGRQCTMGRSDIHPSLCRFHSEREDQLFGDPAPGGNVVGAALDLPELYSACRDLTTAAGVNRALAQVFRLLAQRRISRQEAATFGHLAQLLLRTISDMRVLAGESPAANVYQQDELRGVDKNHQELSPDNKVAADNHSYAGSKSDHHSAVERQKGVAITPLLAHEKVELSPLNKVTDPIRSSGESDDATSKVAPSDQPGPITGNSSAPPIAPAAPSEPLAECTARKSSPGMNTCADVVRNSRKMSTSEIAGFKLTQNEHLRKKVRGYPPAVFDH